MKTAAMLALFGLSSCSFIGVKGPPVRMPDDGRVECTDDRVLPIIDTVVALAGIGLGTALGVDASQDPSQRSMAKGIAFLFLGVPAIAVGLIGGASATYGYYKVSDCNDAKRSQRQDEQQDDDRAGRYDRLRRHAADEQRPIDEQKKIDWLNLTRRQAQERAGILTNTAADAARAGDCATVKKLDPKVRDLDAEFRETVFVRDAAIARCLAPSPPPPTPPPVQQP